MPDVHIKTFLGNACRNSALNVQRYARYGAPGSKGHNYHWGLEKAVRQMVIEGAPFDMAVGHINSIAKDDERLNNREGANVFHQWWIAHKAAGFDPPNAILPAPKGELRVMVRPDFATKKGKSIEVVLVWNAKDPDLPERVAGLGVHIMQRTLGPLLPPTTRFVVHNLRTKLRHLAGSIPKNADSILAIELLRQEEAYLAKPPSK